MASSVVAPSPGSARLFTPPAAVGDESAPQGSGVAPLILHALLFRPTRSASSGLTPRSRRWRWMACHGDCGADGARAFAAGAGARVREACRCRHARPPIFASSSNRSAPMRLLPLQKGWESRKREEAAASAAAKASASARKCRRYAISSRGRPPSSSASASSPRRRRRCASRHNRQERHLRERRRRGCCPTLDRRSSDHPAAAAAGACWPSQRQGAAAGGAECGGAVTVGAEEPQRPQDQRSRPVSANLRCLCRSCRRRWSAGEDTARATAGEIRACSARYEVQRAVT